MLESNLGILPQHESNQDTHLGREAVLHDFKIACLSREVSLLARREVLTGKAKFGISGDGKEVPQIAMARAFRKGDFRSGYYRDQTFMLALGLMKVEQFFAQLYADAENDPFSGGRQMNAHFATPLIDEEGNWLDSKVQYNVSSDIAPTVATKVFAAVITSSPGLIPITFKLSFIASVPEFTPTAYLEPIKLANFFSNFI